MRGRTKLPKTGMVVKHPIDGNLLAEVFVGFRGMAKKAPGTTEKCKRRGLRAGYRADVCLLVDARTGYVVSRGVSVCSPKDEYSLREGRLRASGRALKFLAVGWESPQITHGDTVRALLVLGLDSIHSKSLLETHGVYCAYLAWLRPDNELSILERKALYAWRKRHGFVNPDMQEAGTVQVEEKLVVRDHVCGQGLSQDECLACEGDFMGKCDGLGARVGGE